MTSKKAVLCLQNKAHAAWRTDGGEFHKKEGLFRGLENPTDIEVSRTGTLKVRTEGQAYRPRRNYKVPSTRRHRNRLSGQNLGL